MSEQQVAIRKHDSRLISTHEPLVSLRVRRERLVQLVSLHGRREQLAELAVPDRPASIHEPLVSLRVRRERLVQLVSLHELLARPTSFYLYVLLLC